MRIFKYLSISLALFLSNACFTHADTGIDGTATTSSSFTMTGPVFISSLTVGGSLAVSSGVFTTSLTIPNGTKINDAAAYGQLHLLQSPVIAITNTATATTSSTFQSTNLTAAITPVSSASTILILVSAPMVSGASSTIAELTVFNGSTNLASTHGISILSGAASTLTAQSSFVFSQASPGTSSQTYTVKIRSADGSSNVVMGALSVPMYLVMLEVI